MYIVEGTIGAGKSTFLKLLAHYLPHIDIKLESVDVWQSQQHGQSLLSNFYQNPTRWAYTFETFTMICRAREYFQEQISTRPLIIERSIYSGHYVFARNSFENGFMNDIEWTIYQEWFDFLTKNIHKPQGFIYLKVSPEVAYERIQKRNRTGEETVSLDYLRQIDEQHEKFLIKKEQGTSTLADIPVLVIDCNEEFELNTEKHKEQYLLVQNFLATTHL